MMKLITLLNISLLAFGLMSCNTSTNHVRKNEPDMSLATEFGFDSTQLIYQYYQKFGFGEMCEDIRMLCKAQEPQNFKKSLPISDDDLKKINQFPNKVDSINGAAISLVKNTRREFQDIELDFTEFSLDSLPTIQLANGEYEIIETEWSSTLIIYDVESGLLYLESHRCDGT
jgi:hypothetical protein